MSNPGQNIGDAPGLSGPPDPEPSVLDDVSAVEELLAEKLSGDNSFIIETLAEVACSGWAMIKWVEQLPYVQRHVQPIIEQADREAREARRRGRPHEDD